MEGDAWLNLPTKGSCYERFDDRKISCTSSKLKVALQEEEGKIRHRYGCKLKGCVNATSSVVQSESFPGFSGGWQIVTAVERSQQSRGHFLRKRRTLLWFMNFWQFFDVIGTGTERCPSWLVETWCKLFCTSRTGYLATLDRFLQLWFLNKPHGLYEVRVYTVHTRIYTHLNYNIYCIRYK